MGLLRCFQFSSVYNVRNLIFGVLLLAQTAHSILPLRKPCGDIECQALEFCRQHDHTCQPCLDICTEGRNNYDSDRCESDCQDHIHNERYLSLQNSTLLELQRSELEDKYKGLEKDVIILKIIVGICIAVIAVVVACLAAFLVYFWKLTHPTQEVVNGEKKKMMIGGGTKSAELPTVYNNRYGVTIPTPENSPSTVSAGSPADTNITTVTNSSIGSSYPTPPGVMRSSPAKSECSATTPGTATTTLSTIPNGKSYTDIRNKMNEASIPNTNRFRREPSESMLPENCAYDNLSMSPQHYSHHV